MIIEEGTVIILGNGARYYLAHEIGELEDFEGKYYFSVGVLPNDKLNANDITFLQVLETDQGPTATKLEKNTELYSALTCLEVTKVLMDTVPGYKDKLISDLQKIDMEESSN